jgi:hypothetical protein
MAIARPPERPRKAWAGPRVRRRNGCRGRPVRREAAVARRSHAQVLRRFPAFASARPTGYPPPASRAPTPAPAPAPAAVLSLMSRHNQRPTRTLWLLVAPSPGREAAVVGAGGGAGDPVSGQNSRVPKRYPYSGSARSAVLDHESVSTRLTATSDGWGKKERLLFPGARSWCGGEDRWLLRVHGRVVPRGPQSVVARPSPRPLHCEPPEVLC